LAFTSTYAVLTTDEANMIEKYVRKHLLPVIEHDGLMGKLVDKDIGKFPTKSGTTMELRRRLPFTLDPDATAVSLQYTDPTPQKFKGMVITATVRTLQGATEYSKLTKKVDLFGLQDIMKLMRLRASESRDKAWIDQVSPKLMHVRADWDLASPYQKIFISTTGCSTVAIAGNGITGWAQANDYWGGNSTVGYLTDIGRHDNNSHLTRSITDFVADGDIATVAAFENTPADLGETFLGCIGTGLTRGTDKLSADTLANMAALFNYIMKGSISGYMYSNPGGSMGWKLLADAETYKDLVKDTDQKTWKQYNAKSDGFSKYDAGTYFDFNVQKYSNLYRETAAGVASATGDVHNVLALGKHAIITSEMSPLRFYVNGGEGRTDSSNRQGKRCWIDYGFDYAIEVQDACAGASILTAPTLIS